MPRGKKELAEQIIPKLREVEVEAERQDRRGGGQADWRDEAGLLTWKKKLDGLRIDQAKRLKEPEKENTRLGGGRPTDSGAA